MGGGFRGKRRSYARATANNTTLDDFVGNESTERRVFISFHAEDEAQVNLLRQQAKDEKSDIKFTDYSVKEPFDEKWKTRATERIKQSSVVIVMVGPETHKREAVNWEINKAYELGKKVICVRIYRDENHKIPQQCKDNNAKIMNWDLEAIGKELEKE
jgi:DNA-directed RNA polymerase subunit L